MNLRVLIMRKMAASYDLSGIIGGSHFYTFLYSTPLSRAGCNINKQKRDRNLLAHLVPNLFFRSV